MSDAEGRAAYVNAQETGSRMTTYSLVECRPGWFLILADDGEFYGYSPTVPEATPVVPGADPSLTDFRLDVGVAVVKRWLAMEEMGLDPRRSLVRHRPG
jgi:hypothetical protein